MGKKTKEKVRVLMFGWEFPPMINGGLGSACYGLTRHMALNDLSIIFVLPHISKRMHHYFLELVDGREFDLPVLDDQSIEYREKYAHLEQCIEHDALLAPYDGADRYSTIYERLGSAQKNYMPTLLGEVSRYAQLGKLLGEKKDFDLIHAHDWMSFDAGIAAKKISKKPLVIHFHTTEYDRRTDAPDRAIVEVEQRAIDNADAIIVVSKLMKKQIVSRYKVDSNKIEVVYNAIEKGETIQFDKKLTEFHNKRVIFFLGRITSQKGPAIFLEAAQLIKEKYNDVVFVMAGDGDMASYVKQECSRKKMDECFFFPGHLRGAEKEKLLAVSDIYVLSSLSEPFGITLAEVMHYEIPIIMTEGLGAKEVVPNAIEFKYGDPQDLARKLEELLESPQLGIDMVRNYGKHLDRLDWDISAKKVEQIYKRLL